MDECGRFLLGPGHRISTDEPTIALGPFSLAPSRVRRWKGSLGTGEVAVMKAFSTQGLLCVTLVAILGGLAPVRADHLERVKIIDVDQLKAWIDQGKEMLLIDSRVAAEFTESHLPTAISLPTPSMDQYRDRLPKDPDYPLVFYCNGWPECKKSHDACSLAVQWGYRQVYWFREGLPVWSAKGYPTE